MKNSSAKSALLGAAFLMATSAVGPGFITQTTVFTQQLLASFGFVILCSILLDIGAQTNIWRIVAVSQKKAQDIANAVLPGMGYLLAGLIVAGGLAFNIGNIGGAGLGLNVLTGLDVKTSACISAVLAVMIFWFKEAGMAMDWLARILGFIMIGLVLYVAIVSHPPVAEAIHYTFVPKTINTMAIVTLVGGTVGGYISFAGAHRLLDAGVTGQAALPQVTRSSVRAILLASLIRILLFAAVLGVVSTGVTLDPANPPASVFLAAAGQVGYKMFGIILWSAAITSVIGAAYTSVSFIRSFHPWLEKNQRLLVTVFIVFSTLVFAVVGKPVKTLIVVGALNGLILPAALLIMLLAVWKTKIVGSYKHPVWMTIAGWIVVVIMAAMGGYTLWNNLAGL